MNVDYLWDLDDDPRGNVEKLRQHGLTPEDAMYVIEGVGRDEIDASRSSDRPIVFGETEDGRFVAVVFEWADDDLIYVVTGFCPTEA
ncbi:MAG TPA: hypothetical protein VF170_19900 [Planctomycetaceae bacterium]